MPLLLKFFFKNMISLHEPEFLKSAIKSEFFFILQLISPCTANICNQSATVVQLIVAKIATFSFCNFWLPSLLIVGCKVNIHLMHIVRLQKDIIEKCVIPN